MKKLLLLLLVLMGTATFAQVGIGTAKPNKSAMLDVDGGSGKGVLIPRVALPTTTNTGLINGYSTTTGYPASLLVYSTGATGVAAGYYYWSGGLVADGGKWNRLSIDTPNSVTPTTVSMTASANDETILVTIPTAATADVVIKLPTAVGVKGKKYNIKKLDATAYYVSIISEGGRVEGEPMATGIYGSTYLQGWALESDGTDWWVISRI